MRIGILLHENERCFETIHLFIRPLGEEWKSMGYSIEVIWGTRRHVPVDVLIPQIDLTARPRRYREFIARYPVVLNRDLHDISKRLWRPRTWVSTRSNCA